MIIPTVILCFGCRQNSERFTFETYQVLPHGDRVLFSTMTASSVENRRYTHNRIAGEMAMLREQSGCFSNRLTRDVTIGRDPSILAFVVRGQKPDRSRISWLTALTCN